MKRTLLLAALAAGSGLAAAPAAQAAWTRSYAVEWNEPAMFYGAKDGVIEPGTDCPKGSNAEPNWVQELMDSGYSKQEAEWLRNPANPTRSPINGQNQMAFRGKDRANVYIHPTSIAESGKFFPVSGKIGEGVDLDGDKSNGFVSPTGETGIDNNFYKALGCWKTYRGPTRKSSGALQFNDSMREGGWTTVIVVSGKGNDPMNEKDAQIAFYVSNDKLVKDGNGEVAHDYTFRVKPDAKNEAIFKAKVVKGRIITASLPEMHMRNPAYDRDLELLKAKADFQMQPDGSLKGYLGGYRPWKPVYDGWVAARGPVIEALTWVRLPDVYYALQRYADYSPTGPNGPKTHISFALRVDAVPAFVMTPDAAVTLASAQSFKAQAPKTPGGPQGAGLGSIRVVDGIVVGRGQLAVSQSPEQLRPPASSQADAKPLAAAAISTGGG